MQLYNTLTKKIAELKPLKDKVITIYTCGPTVYDYPHIGNWFTFVRYDVLVRTLKASGYTPKWVMNITDVGHLVSDADEGEDKLEKGAHREGKTAWDVATFYGDYFVRGMQRLNMSQPDYLPKATEHIPEQIALIQVLEKKSYTYVIDDGVYYDTAKFKDYDKFAQLDLDEQQAGARVSVNPQKRNASDFALWKFSPKGTKRDMEWDSPWGKGFPGWHIECSAMSAKYLGETIDVHAGGIDHIPVHHTNEIAQSEAATGKPFAQYWMHTNHITVDDQKISKSLGNGITLEDVEKQGFSLMALRLHILESHYRSQSKFSWVSLEAAQNRLKSLYGLAVMRWQTTDKGSPDDTFDETWESILADMQTDLASPSVLAKLSAIQKTQELHLLPTKQRPSFETFLQNIDGLLGLDLYEQANITADQKKLLEARRIARQNQDWKQSDALRRQLNEHGLEVRDTSEGQIWSRL